MGIVCISINTRNKTITNYHNYNFNSLFIYKDSIHGFKDDGLYRINEEYSKDGDDNIDAFAVTLDSDLGTPNKKKLRFMFMQYQTSGNILLSYMADRDITSSSKVLPIRSAMKPHSKKISTTRRVRGTYFKFKFENIIGSDFTISTLDSNVVVVNSGNSLS